MFLYISSYVSQKMEYSVHSDTSTWFFFVVAVDAKAAVCVCVCVQIKETLFVCGGKVLSL